MIPQWLFALLALLSGLIYAEAVTLDTVNSFDVVVTSTEVFSNIFGSGSLTYTETFTLASIASSESGYTTIDGIYASRPSSLTSKTGQVSMETPWDINTTTASITVPVTITQPASTVTITVSALNQQSTATGLCYWGQEAILTPCTDLVLATATVNATQKSAAISLGAKNIFKPVIQGFKSFFSFRFSSREEKRVTARFEMFGQQWDADCMGFPMIYSPVICMAVAIGCSFFMFCGWHKNTPRRNAINMALVALFSPIMAAATYLELYARPSAKLSTWYEKCRQPCALLSENTTALCLAANNVSDNSFTPGPPAIGAPLFPQTD